MHRSTTPTNYSYTEISRQTVTSEPASISFQHENKAFTLSGIQDVNQLKIYSPNLQFKVLQNNDISGQYRIIYDPKGVAHEVAVYYMQQVISGTPFRLAPKPVQLEFQPGNKSFSIHNVHLPDQLQVKSDSLHFKMYEDAENTTTFHVLHEPSGEVHDVDIQYRGETIENGQFRLAPRTNSPSVQQYDQNKGHQFQTPMIIPPPQHALQYPMQQPLYPVHPLHYQVPTVHPIEHYSPHMNPVYGGVPPQQYQASLVSAHQAAKQNQYPAFNHPYNG